MKPSNPMNHNSKLLTHVQMVQLPPCRVSTRWCPLERKRRIWWHNARRNELIATVAQALASPDAEGLQHARLLLGYPDSRIMQRGLDVVVLVESTRHGSVLLECLPGWEMFAALPEDDEEENEPRVTTPCRGRIVTLVYAASHCIVTDAVVRATGGCGKLSLDGDDHHGSIVINANFLIDFIDLSDQYTARNTRRRIEAYKQQGLQVMETSLVE